MSASTRYVVEDFGVGSFSTPVFDATSNFVASFVESLFPTEPCFIFCPNETSEVKDLVPSRAFIEPTHNLNAYQILRVTENFVTYDELIQMDLPVLFTLLFNTFCTPLYFVLIIFINFL